MNKTITILLILLVLCTLGYWFLPTFSVLIKGDADFPGYRTEYTCIPLSLLEENSQETKLLFTGLSILFLLPPIFTLLSYKKVNRLLIFLLINMPLALLASYMLWGLFLMEDEYFNGETDHGTYIYKASIGIYLAFAASILNMACIILVLVNRRKQKLLTPTR
jgi:hypothetical protein